MLNYAIEVQGSISLQSDIEMTRTKIRQFVEAEDSNSNEGYKVKELQSSLFGEIRMATYSIERCHGSFVCRQKGGRDIVY